jgi:hypothetical protein
MILFSFPKNEEIRFKWIKFLKLNKDDNLSHVRICSQHFNPSDFVEDSLQMSRTRRQLKITAIPSIKRITQVTCYERPSAKVLYYKESSTSTYVPVQTPTVEILSSGIAEMEQTKSTLVVCVNEGII